MVGAPGATATPPQDVVERHTAAATEAEQRDVARYWSPERMRAAIPVGEQVTPSAKPEGKGNNGKGGGKGGISPMPQHGKVFFTMRGLNYVRSGTATQSGNGDVVTTAGHCLNEGPGNYVSNFAFVPAYDNGDRPYGTWAAETLLTTSQWKDSGDLNHDVGFAVMAENSSGQSLTQVVGSYPIAFHLGYELRFDSYGYPAANPYDGQDLHSCSGTSGTDGYGTDDHSLTCAMTGGASGGGWITGGKLNSVNSFYYSGEEGVLYGPYFGSTEQAVYQAASTS